MTSIGVDPALLPAPDDAPRCAEHAGAIELDPAGSALHVDEVLLIDVPLPWPKPVWAADGFTHLPEAVMAAGEQGRRVRALAAVPLDDGIARIVVHQRIDGLGPMVRSEFRMGADEVGHVADLVLREGPAAGDPWLVDVPVPPREVAICAQGSHDICCGSDGMRLVNQLLAVRPGLTVRKVSHTGGHRYAPTGLTFPDGRMWGFTSVEEMGRLVDRDGTPASVAHRCRGWTGTDGIGQVGERAVFALLDDWAVDDVPRTVATEPVGDGWIVSVGVAGRRFEVEVERGRAVPTIACRAEGGLPAKPGTEYRVLAISEVPGGD